MNREIFNLIMKKEPRAIKHQERTEKGTLSHFKDAATPMILCKLKTKRSLMTFNKVKVKSVALTVPLLDSVVGGT